MPSPGGDFSARRLRPGPSAPQGPGPSVWFCTIVSDRRWSGQLPKGHFRPFQLQYEQREADTSGTVSWSFNSVARPAANLVHLEIGRILFGFWLKLPFCQFQISVTFVICFAIIKQERCVDHLLSSIVHRYEPWNMQLDRRCLECRAWI